MAGERHAPLMDRIDERLIIDELLSAVRAGHSQVLAMHGEAGVGKTALLRYLKERAMGLRVVRAVGVQSEMELAFAGLHQLCRPLLDRLDDVPGPQRDALLTAFGLSAGPPPDRFLVGLAALSLLSAAAEDRPLIAIVDDAQWLDRASAQALGFVGRRLAADAVGLVFAARVPGDEVSGLRQMTLDGLKDADARALLDSVLTGPFDERVRDRFIAEARGNPLALLELPRGLTAAELAGGYGLVPASALPGRIEDSFRRQISALPVETQRLLVLAAADSSGDLALVWRAAGRLGIGAEAAEPAADADLAEFGPRLRFRHPLVRSAAYRSASADDRRRAHLALAEATDRAVDPDRRAWHRAQAASGPDEQVAAELEQSADRARARGGLAAAAAFLERAATLTLDQRRRAGRSLAAAQAKVHAGAFDEARVLLAAAEAGPLSELQQAKGDLLRARLAFVTNRGSEAPPLLLAAARRLEPIDVGLAQAAYLEAMSAALFAGRLAAPGGGPVEIGRAARAAPRSSPDQHALGLLIGGLAALFTDGDSQGLALAGQALADFGRGMSADEELRSLWLACAVALHGWDDERWEALSDRFVRVARGAGSLSELPLALTMRAHLLLFCGQRSAAASLIGELEAVEEATGTKVTPYSELFHLALGGDEARATELADRAAKDAVLRGEGVGIAVIGWTQALLGNGLGHYAQAVTASQRASGYGDGAADLGVSNWALAELVEAAVRNGMSDAAAGALGRLTEITAATGTDWALGVEARCRALLSEGDAAERLYREAITRLGRTRLRPDLARAHLLYGEWLRGERRRTQARDQLRTAHGMLEAMGMDAFAERARRELQASGETAGKRAQVPGERQLTAQEAQIARMARDGLSNPEIGARLFISARTVQYHLGKIFAKLDINARGQLHDALADDPGGNQAR